MKLIAKSLPKSFYRRDTVTVARDLLGKILLTKTAHAWIGGPIVEVEAYLGELDAASHSFRGETARCAPMFAAGGVAYVYFTYGAHYCFNVVTAERGVGHAVLVRALAPEFGLPLMQQRRRRTELRDLCSGPGKLCQALGIGPQMNGIPLTGSAIQIRDGEAPTDIAVSARIGITKNAAAPLRFFAPNSPWISKRLKA